MLFRSHANRQGSLRDALAMPVGVPAPVVRLVGEVQAALSPAFVEAQLVALDQARCGPGTPVVGVGFDAVFGYGGQMEKLAADVPGPVSPRAAARFAAAETVRAAFFTPGISGPVVPFTLRLMTISPSISPVTVGLGPRLLELTPGGAAVPAVWTNGGFLWPCGLSICSGRSC